MAGTLIALPWVVLEHEILPSGTFLSLGTQLLYQGRLVRISARTCPKCPEDVAAYEKDGVHFCQVCGALCPE